ncbi:unnamed protein product [Brassica oleracea]
MYASDCRYRGYILLLVLFYSLVFDLASKIDISDDVRGNQTDSNWKRFLSNSNQHGKEYTSCISVGAEIPKLYLFCDESPKDIITKINFADYGNTISGCKDNRHGNCSAPAALRVVKKNCLGKLKCELKNSDEMFGPSHCKKDIKLTVEYTCTKS